MTGTEECLSHSACLRSLSPVLVGGRHSAGTVTDTCLSKPSAVEQNRPEERLVGPAAPITGLVPRTLPPPLRRMRLRGRENRLELASSKEILRLTSERPKWGQRAEQRGFVTSRGKVLWARRLPAPRAAGAAGCPALR